MATNIRLDVKRANQWHNNLFSLHQSPRPRIIPKERKNCRNGSRRGHNLHMCRVGCQLSNGTRHQLLHVNPTRIHLGWNFPLVHVPLGLRSNANFHLNNRLQRVSRNACTSTVILVCNAFCGDRGFNSLLLLQSGSNEILPSLPWNDPMD